MVQNNLVASNFIMAGFRPFPIELHDHMFHTTIALMVNAYEIYRCPRSTANEYLEGGDGNMVLFLGFLDGALVLFRK
jgi:hypothetical protein